MEKPEIERRWLLKRSPNRNFFDPNKFDVEKIKITQHYLGSSVRLRKSVFEDSSFLFEHFTKEWQGNMTSLENVSTLEPEEWFERTKQAISIVNKTRLKVTTKANGIIYEFDHLVRKTKADVYLLEIEFDNIIQAEAFELPGILHFELISEITNIREFSNYALSELI